MSCNDYREILPRGKIQYFSNYHCWPFDVKVYSINDFTFDSLIFSYPLPEFCSKLPKCNLTKWSQYSSSVDSEWYGFDKTLEKCDDNTELINQLKNESTLFYAGCHKYYLDQNGIRKKGYIEIMFLDTSQKKLHLFENINLLY